MNPKTTFCALLAVASIPLAASAQDASLTLPTISVETDLIERSAVRAHEAKASAPNAITVIEAEQLNQFGDQPLGDALRRVPGVTFEAANRAREVRLRGLPGEYTQVLVNGRPLLDGESRRTVEVDRIPSSMVERVEIIRSPRASQDAQGVAGTVNVILKSGVALPPQWQIGVGAGYLQSNGELGDATFLAIGEAGPLAYNIAGGVQRQRRSESKDFLNFNAAGASTGSDIQTNKRRFDQINFTSRFDLTLGENDRLFLEPLYLRTKETRDDIQTPFNAAGVAGRRENELRLRIRETFGLYGGWAHSFGPATTLTLSNDLQVGSVETSRDATRFNVDGSINRSRQRSEQIDLFTIRPAARLDHVIGPHALAFGVDWGLRTAKETNGEITNGVVAPPRADRVFEIGETRLNGFVEDVWTVNERFTVTAGLRLEHSQTRTKDATGARTDTNALLLLPSFHARYALTPDTDLRAGVARTVRRPDLRKLSPLVESRNGTAADPDRRGNPLQKPENVWGLDVGIDRYFLNGEGLVSVNAFARRFNDKIEEVVAVEAGRFVSVPRNVGGAHAFGLEVEARAPLSMIGLDPLTIWANGVYTHARVDEAGGGNRRFLDQPDVVTNIGLDWHIRSLSTTLGVALNWASPINQTQRLGNGGRLDSSIGARTRLDMSARTQITEKFAFTLSATNLLGQTEERTDTVFDAGGARTSSTKTREPTYRSVYGRLTWSF